MIMIMIMIMIKYKIINGVKNTSGGKAVGRE